MSRILPLSNEDGTTESRRLEPDRDQIEIFVDALFRHANPKGIVSVRAFYENDKKVFRISPTPCDLRFLVDVAVDDAYRAANAPKPVVFCPPIAIFASKERARETDIAEGLALSVECDDRAQEARIRLETVLGPATVVVASGGKWTDANGNPHDRLHLHWRLAVPARGEALPRLKQARDLATRLVGGDPHNKPMCHPMRWAGSWHRKDKDKPILCRIEHHDADREIDLDAALAALIPLVPEPTSPRSNGSAGEPTAWSFEEEASVRSALARISAEDRSVWFQIGCALHSTGWMQARSIWDDWAQTCPQKFDAADQEKTWQSFSRKRSGDDITLGTLFHIARQNEPPPDSPSAAQTATNSGLAIGPWWRDPADIPPREKLFGNHYIRRVVSATIAAGGRAKTTNAVFEAVQMATGRDMTTGTPLPSGPLRVGILNGAEHQNELDRLVAATCQHYGVSKDELGDRLFVKSVRERPLRIATLARGDTAIINKNVTDDIAKFIRDNAIDVLIVDPLVSFHSVKENVNEHMDVVFKEGFGNIAHGTNSAVEVLHHAGKPRLGQPEASVEDGRGASAILWAVRIARVLNFMTTDEASKLGITEDDRRLHIRIADGKANPVPLGKAKWLKLKPENLANGDQVACASSWTPPNPFDGVTTNDMELARHLAQTGTYRADIRSKEWFGWRIAELLKIPIRHGGDNTKANIARVKAIIKKWLETGVLATETREDEHRKERAYIIAGAFNPLTRPSVRTTYDDDDIILQ